MSYSESHPNIILVLTDDQGYGDLSCLGNPILNTPNLDHLYADSIRLTDFHVSPMCTPTRGELMTGYDALNNGATFVCMGRSLLKADLLTMADILSDNGYHTGHFGKWHLGDEVIRQRGFDEWVSIMDRLYAEYTKPEYIGKFSDYREYLVNLGYEPDLEIPGGKIFSDEMRSTLPVEHQQAPFLADNAERFIRDNAENPFVMYVSMLEPHPPFNGPYNHLYDPDKLPVDPSFLKPPEGGPLVNRLRSEYYMQGEFDGHDLSTEAGWRQLRANYMGHITLVDDAVGKIVNALEDSGVADNTILVFTSEHGDLVGSHAMLELRSFYEPVSKVPMMIRIPWLPREQRIIEGNFSQIDLLPTLLELMGEPVPEFLQGKGRSNVIEGKSLCG